MGIADNDGCLEMAAIGTGDTRGVGGIAVDVGHLFADKHLTAIPTDGPDKAAGNAVAASYHAPCTTIIEIHHKSIGGKRGLVFLCGIKGQIAYHHLP